MKKIFITLPLLFLLAPFHFLCIAQKQGQEKIDSLMNVLKGAKEDTLKVNTLIAVSLEKINAGEYKGSEEYANQALALSEKMSFLKGVSLSYNQVGLFHHYSGDYPIALEYFQRALKISMEIKDKLGISEVYNNIGNVYFRQGNYPEALKNDFLSLKLKEEVGDKNGIAGLMHNIGIIYASLDDYKEALNYFSKAKTENLRSGNKQWLAYNLVGIGHLYTTQGNYKEALIKFEESLAIEEEIGDKTGITTSLSNKGWVNTLQGDYSKALKNLFAALKISEEIGYKESTANTYINIGEVYQKQNNLNEALAYETKGLSLALEIGVKDAVKEAYGSLAVIDSAMGNFKGAYEYHKLYKQTNDSIFNMEKDKKLVSLQMTYDFDKKHLADSLQFDQSKKLSEEKYQRQRTATYGGFGALALVAMLLFFVIRSNVKQRKTNKLLKETQQQLVQQEKLASLGALTAGIAHEIQNPLNFINNFSELSTELIEEIKTVTEEIQRDEILADLNQNLLIINQHGKRADNIVKNMLRHSRGTTGELQLTDMNALCTESVNLSYHAMRSTYPDFNTEIIKKLNENLPSIKIMHQDISRVVLNLVNNAFFAVMKKSELEKDTEENEKYKPSVLLSTHIENGFVMVSLKDNGGGIPEHLIEKIFEPFFTTKPPGQGTGLGLSISYDIVKAHNGNLTVTSEGGKGATFIISLPV
jgi:two-component system NtrC family sensor kinase